MKLLIAVKSCQRDRDLGLHDAIRGTWGKEARDNGIDVRFFVAANFSKYEADETHLNCQDDYMHLPQKTRRICDWVKSRIYDFMFVVDVDTFVRPALLKTTGFEQFDYSGRFGNAHPIGTQFHYTDTQGIYPACWPWASGGFGYFLSRDAARLVSEEPPTVWAEDMYVGQVLGPFQKQNEITIGDIDSKTEHFYKCRKYPTITPELLLRAHKEGGFGQITQEGANAR